MKKFFLSAFFRPKKHLDRYLYAFLIALFIAGIVWLQESYHQTRFPASDKPIELYSNQTGDNLTKTFTDAMDKAQHSILLVVYTLTDPQIIQKLHEKSLQGLDVWVMTDAQASPHIDNKLGPNVKSVRRFGKGLMHQKILVIDDQQTWIGSANMTSESLRMHGNLVAAIEDPSLAKTIREKVLTMKVTGINNAYPFKYYHIGGQEIEMWFLPDNKRAPAHIKELIKSASKSIRIAMFTWTRHDFAQEVIKASKRGVQVEIVVDRSAGKGANADVVRLLLSNGIKVCFNQGAALLHHKFMYIDGNLLVQGSANWTKAAFNINDDCFVVMHDLTPPQTSHMEALWHIISCDSRPAK